MNVETLLNKVHFYRLGDAHKQAVADATRYRAGLGGDRQKVGENLAYALLAHPDLSESDRQLAKDAVGGEVGEDQPPEDRVPQTEAEAKLAAQLAETQTQTDSPKPKKTMVAAMKRGKAK